jgi:hypothetical protein
MILRSEDFVNKSVFLCLVEQAQIIGLIKEGKISCDEDSVVNIDDIDISVVPTMVT